MKINIALILKNTHPINKERFFQIADFNKLDVFEKVSDLIEKKIDLLYCSDSLDISTFLTLIFRVKSDKIFFHALEMYSISFKALISEIKLKLNNVFSLRSFYLISVWIIKFMLIKFLLKFNKHKIIISSISRKKYLMSNYNSHKILISPNYPLSQNFNMSDKSELSNDLQDILRKKYFYIPGNIHNLKEFKELSTLLSKMNLNIVFTSSKKLPKDLKNKNIIETGTLNKNKIFNLIKNSVGGIALFDKRSINQNLCASSKLYEFLFFNRSVIVSDVHEINELMKSKLNSKLFFKDQINEIVLRDSFFNSKNIHNYEYTHEQNLLNLL